jgi:hypothetical protein
MSLSGPEALRSLDGALRDIRREEDELAKRLAKSAEMISKIQESESELFRQLAEVRLDPGTQAELTGRLSQAEQAARDVLKRHAGAMAEAEATLKAHDEKLAALQNERTALVTKSTEHENALKAIAARIAAEVAKDPSYVAKRQVAEELMAVAGQSLRKTEQAEADREQKGRPYRDDPLFMYLWERGFGTKNYRANNLVMWLDGLVAGLVGYPEARPNFAMLNEIPMRLREHAEAQRAKAEAAVAEVTALQEAAVDAAGGKPVREALSAASERIAAIDAEVVSIEDARDDAAKAQRDLAQGDPAFAGAVTGLAESLGRQDIQTLLAEARATRTPEDDAILKQIDDARARAREEEDESKDQKARLKTLATRRRELEDIQYEFKKQGYDRPESTFREDKLVGDVLTEFLRGGITAASYWDKWRRSQNWNSGYDPWRQTTGSASGGFRYDNDDDDDDDDDRRRKRKKIDRDDDDDDNAGPWGGGFSWPDNSFSGGSRRPSGGSWGRLPGVGGSGGGGFSRPRGGGFGGGGGFRTGGGFKSGGGFKTGGGF